MNKKEAKTAKNGSHIKFQEEFRFALPIQGLFQMLLMKKKANLIHH